MPGKEEREEDEFLPLGRKETARIVEGIEKGRNVIVTGLAGSGKTTTINQAAGILSEKGYNILKLQLEPYLVGRETGIRKEVLSSLPKGGATSFF
jgi:energy-coupling factor transporter ATP-binding protein EcfA2